jgi:hypothetical protein
MRSFKIVAVLSVGMWVLFVIVNTTAVGADRGTAKIALLDNCDPRIAAGWNTAADMTQCLRKEGFVSRPEFLAFLSSPFSLSVVGHPSWTIAPTYSLADADERLRVRNAGGRGHTFTEVAEYGGGFVAVLNMGLIPAPECAASAGSVIPPGGRGDVTGLAVGNHKFQCCIHPWMRALVKVQSEEEDK